MIMTEIEGWLLSKLREVEPEAQQEDIYTGKITLGGAWVLELMEEWHIKQQKQVNNLAIPVVSKSVALCGSCKKELTLVRPSKYQCDNENCPSNVC